MAGTLFVSPRFVAVDSSGTPLSGALLYTYRAGTTTLANTFTTRALDTPHSNPIVSDANGVFPAIFLDTDAGYNYKFVLQNSNGEQVWSEDNIPVGVVAGTTGPTGEPGLSVAELTIYKRATSAPATPTGGSFDFSNQTLTPPATWSVGIPAGNDPVYVSRAVATSTSPNGTDDTLGWSTPVKALSDGSSVDIIFKRSATQPATPAPSPGVPATWYTDVDSVPASSDKLWSSTGTRANEGQDWVWQLPVQVEGNTGPSGPPGDDATFYYIKPTNGTALKNGAGTLTVEARRIVGGTDTKLSTGTVQIYSGNTLCTVANGFATGSDGYTVVVDSGDIAGAITLTLKDGVGGTAKDTITLVDIADGEADTGKDAVYGYVNADGPLAWVRESDGTTWIPAGTTVQLDCTFVQAGADVARVAWVITRDSSGILTGASGTHSGGDLNSGRVTVTEVNESSQVMGVEFAYSNAGDVAQVAETVYTSMSGSDGATGPTGPTAQVLALTKRHIPVMAYQDGTVISFADANGQATVYEGTTDVTASATLSATATGCTGTINTAVDTPVAGQPKGYYRITAMSGDVGTLEIESVYNTVTITDTVTISKQYVGYEIVASLPGTNLFQGRVVYLTTLDGVNEPDKLYRYNGSAWVATIPAVDISGTVGTAQIAASAITAGKIAAGAVVASAIASNAVTADKIQAGAVTAAKISVTSLSALTANVGTVNAGVVQNSSGGAKFDLSNARIIFNTNPGATGGFVRVMGYGFGPSAQYIDWYGPKPSGQFTDAGIIANLSDSTALSFQRVDGTMFSKGRIRGEFEPKAWAAINGEGSPTIKDRFNVASVSKLGTGRYRLTFAEALPNANYACVTGGSDASKIAVLTVSAQTTTYVDIETNRRSDGAFFDISILNIVIFGSNVVGGSNVSSPTGGTGGGTIGGGYLPGIAVLP